MKFNPEHIAETFIIASIMYIASMLIFDFSFVSIIPLSISIISLIISVYSLWWSINKSIEESKERKDQFTLHRRQYEMQIEGVKLLLGQIRDMDSKLGDLAKNEVEKRLKKIAKDSGSDIDINVF
jgi:cell shape-determining protein MreC